ncbi:MAG TPA: hypothetical protein VM099_15415, partial [Gemmatimonadaceae bacterium]|nr:hypothetical protein [Gemmatimonadaceae bacterium]
MSNSKKAGDRLVKRTIFAFVVAATLPASNAVAQDTTKVDSGVVVDTAKVITLLPTSGSVPEARCEREKTVRATRVGAGVMFVGANALLYRYMKRAWWSGERAPHFFFHADWDENFRDQDKFGHLFGGFELARLGYATLRNACMSPS